MQTLKQQLKDKAIEGVYLLYGEETYVRDNYIDRMMEKWP